LTVKSPPLPASSASVRNILTLLASRDAQLVAGSEGLERLVAWACRMRARLPAFDSIRGGELALLTLQLLRHHNETLPHLLKTLHQEGVAAVAVAASSLDSLGHEASFTANQLHLPLILLPSNAPLEEIEREVITFVVNFQGEIERKAADISRQLMQLSIHGAGIAGVCEHLARICHTWVIVQDSEQHVRFQAAPLHEDQLTLPAKLSEEASWPPGLAHIIVPILIRHDIAGYLSLVGKEGEVGYLERMILGQVAPILALEFAREKERNEVESRYQLEAFMDVLQGTYQQPEEMLARARLLGYDLTIPQLVIIFELSPTGPDYPTGSAQAQWSKRVRDELLRVWPASWALHEPRRLIALIPLPVGDSIGDRETREGRGDSNAETENAQSTITQLERIHTRLHQTTAKTTNTSHSPDYSGGIGGIASRLQDIPRSFREAQQALEIGRRLFGSHTLHSFSHLGIYRLLFSLDGHHELTEFYHETLGPLIHADTRGDGTLIETLEAFFRCNGNLSETARTMHLHRNSLLYRLSKIEEILGRSLDDAEVRLSLQIALKIRVMMKE